MFISPEEIKFMTESHRKELGSTEQGADSGISPPGLAKSHQGTHKLCLHRFRDQFVKYNTQFVSAPAVILGTIGETIRLKTAL